MNKFGVGLNIFKAYLEDMRNIFCLLAFSSIIVIYIYSTGNGIDTALNVQSVYGKFSIANLGMDSVHCKIIPLLLDKVHLECPYGYLTELKPNFYGVNKHD